MNRLFLPGLIAVTVLASLVFYSQPQIDLFVSGLFYGTGGFALQKGHQAALLTDIIHYGLRAIVFAALGIAGIVLAVGKAPSWLTWRKYIFVLLSIALAAGLMTNVVLKDHWGRARPNQIVEFGGNKQFTPAWVISDQCRKNCSFVGGDVSFAFCLLAAALVVASRRSLWIALTLGLGTLVAIGRLAAGAHFLSDCVLAALLTAIVVLALWQFIFHNMYYAIKKDQV